MANREAEAFGQAVAAQVRAEIAAANATVASIAREAQINRETLDRWVKGERALSVPTLYRIARALNVDPHIIVLRAEERFAAGKVSPIRPNVGGGGQPVDLHTVDWTGEEAASMDQTPVDPDSREP